LLLQVGQTSFLLKKQAKNDVESQKMRKSIGFSPGMLPFLLFI